MRVLVFGATGMLGHKIVQRLLSDSFDVYATARTASTLPESLNLAPGHLLSSLDVTRAHVVGKAIRTVKPDAVVNCVGIIKQSEESESAPRMVEVNSLFPQRLAEICESAGIRLVHFSTDCVFSGRVGYYSETDLADPVDLYGRSKLAGEPETPSVLAIRTSIIGRELRGKESLVEWFLRQEGTIQGFRKAVFSGLPTVVLAGVLTMILRRGDTLRGVWHVSADPIDKYRLLALLKEATDHDVDVSPRDTPIIDRSLDSSRFRESMDWTPPDWPTLVRALVEDARRHESMYGP